MPVESILSALYGPPGEIAPDKVYRPAGVKLPPQYGRLYHRYAAAYACKLPPFRLTAAYKVNGALYWTFQAQGVPVVMQKMNMRGINFAGHTVGEVNPWTLVLPVATGWLFFTRVDDSANIIYMPVEAYELGVRVERPDALTIEIGHRHDFSKGPCVYSAEAVAEYMDSVAELDAVFFHGRAPGLRLRSSDLWRAYRELGGQVLTVPAEPRAMIQITRAAMLASDETGGALGAYLTVGKGIRRPQLADMEKVR